ncbi:MAG: energy transducer TonB [Limisphaerales bacterium]
MQRLSALQVSFGISLLIHVALITSYEIYKPRPGDVATRVDGSSADSWEFAIAAAPVEPPAPAPERWHMPARRLLVPAQIKMPIRVEQRPRQQPELRIAVRLQTRAAALTAVPAELGARAAATTPVPHSPTRTVAVDGPPAEARPDYLKNPPPDYPAVARRRHEQGVVLLIVGVTAEGRVSRVAIKMSSGFKRLDDAALKAVRKWDFEPARSGPLALASEVEVPIRFELAEP